MRYGENCEIKQRMENYMKKFIALLLCVFFLMSLVACGKKDATTGNALADDFVTRVEENENISAQELADAISKHESLSFEVASMPVEPGLLMGFGNTEITGFSEGVMFAPMVGSIPFLGYIFTLEEDKDVDAFVELLEQNADLRWNICTEAEETVITSVGKKVFFLMAPKNTNLV